MPNKGQLTDALNSSINHWMRMINWVRTQPATDYARRDIMLEQQEEDWTAGYCALCQLVDSHCSECMLTPNCESERSLWRAVVDAEYCADVEGEDPDVQTWAHWLVAAEAMLKHLKDLQKAHEEYVNGSSTSKNIH